MFELCIHHGHGKTSTEPYTEMEDYRLPYSEACTRRIKDSTYHADLRMIVHSFATHGPIPSFAGRGLTIMVERWLMGIPSVQRSM